MKKIIKNLLLSIILLITITGCGSTKTNLKEISFNEFKEKIENKESFAIYIGNQDCSHCNSYKPTLEDVVKEYNITLYHLDNSKLTEEEYDEFETYINISGTPTVAFITDGEEETALNRIVGEETKENTIKRFKINGYIK